MRTKWGPGRFCNRSCCNRFSVTTGNQGKARAQHPEAEGFAEQVSETAGINVVPAELLVAAGLSASMASIIVVERAARAFTSEKDVLQVRATPAIAAV